MFNTISMSDFPMRLITTIGWIFFYWNVIIDALRGEHIRYSNGNLCEIQNDSNTIWIIKNTKWLIYIEYRSLFWKIRAKCVDANFEETTKLPIITSNNGKIVLIHGAIDLGSLDLIY